MDQQALSHQAVWEIQPPLQLPSASTIQYTAGNTAQQSTTPPQILPLPPFAEVSHNVQTFM